jgi:capsular polysaccharide export protein
MMPFSSAETCAKSMRYHRRAYAPQTRVVLDDLGIYYDATKPSRLEVLLNTSGWESQELLARARDCINRLRRLRISKYNAAPEPGPELAARLHGPFVLVVDQTAGDASVNLGFASAEAFKKMLATAQSENPGCRIVVKVHPNVSAGYKQGYLAQLPLGPGVEILDEAVNPWALVETADRVYTVTSQLGFEALMAGKPVRCFGMPFYAG